MLHTKIKGGRKVNRRGIWLAVIFLAERGNLVNGIKHLVNTIKHSGEGERLGVFPLRYIYVGHLLLFREASHPHLTLPN